MDAPGRLLDEVQSLWNSIIALYLGWRTFGWAIVVYMVVNLGSSKLNIYLDKKQMDLTLQTLEQQRESRRYTTSMFRNYRLMKLLTLEDNVFLEMQKQAFKITKEQTNSGLLRNLIDFATEICQMASKAIFLGFFVYTGGELSAAKITIFMSIMYDLLE